MKHVFNRYVPWQIPKFVRVLLLAVVLLIVFLVLDAAFRPVALRKYEDKVKARLGMLDFQARTSINLDELEYPKFNKTELEKIRKAKQCLAAKKPVEKQKLFYDITDAPPKSQNTMFFHDTSCSEDGRVKFTARQACSIESAAKTNPNREIFVLFASPVGLVTNEEMSPIYNALRSYPNVKFRNVNWYNFSIGTPVENWIKKDIILVSKHYIAHLSDFIRLISIYKYGGIHLDMDFVVLRSFDDLPSNFAGEERSDSINNAIFGFEANDVGHKMVERILRENTHNYRPDCWAFSGPGSITRVMQKICGIHDVHNLNPEHCWGFQLFQRPTFFPVEYMRWKEIFAPDRKTARNILRLCQNAYAVHMWNSASVNSTITKSSRSKTAYELLAGKFCPKVLAASGPTF